MKRILAVVLVMLATCLAGAETVKGLAKPTGYVSDYAGVLSADDTASIEQQCTELHQKTGTQVALVTVHTLEGATAQEFAHGISDAWGVGSKGTDKGVVMLIATEDRKRWIDVGYGLEGVLNDAKVGDIGRQMAPVLKIGNYGVAIRMGVEAISAAILSDPANAVPAPAPVKEKDESGLVALLFFGGLAGVVLLVVLLGRRRRNAGPAYYATPVDRGPAIGFIPSSGDSGSSFSASDSSSNFSSDSSSSSGSDSSSSSSGSDFGGFDGGQSGGGGAGGDF